MGKTYSVAEGQEFSYPADKSSLDILRKAGGRAQLRKDDLEKVKFKEVKAGDDCSDMPPESLEVFVERGWVIEHESVEKKNEDKTK